MSLVPFLRKLRRWIGRSLSVLLFFLVVTGSTLQYKDVGDLVHRYTRTREFEFVFWTVDALIQKAGQFSIGATNYLPEDEASLLVREYIALLDEANQLESQLNEISADPHVPDPQSAAAPIMQARDGVRERLNQIQPLVESVLQEQVAITISAQGIDLGGAPFPPVVFRFTQPPMALIVSPRDVIRQDANISLDPALTLEQMTALEYRVERGMSVSALVVPIGGVGIYPTMISESTSLLWITDVVAHEWVHNYLTLRPLGQRYFSNPEMRTMNETTAAILGREIGVLVLARYYPDLVPPPALEAGEASPADERPPVFDFRAQMRETRVRVEALLAEGRIEEAEKYMEARRQYLWDNGYHIRRLNQAYFAFYGAYADEPGGAAGVDPVGEAVRQLWALSESPAEFLRTMAGMKDYQDLQETLTRLTQAN